MKKSILFFILLLVATVATKAQTFQVDTAALNSAYRNLVDNPEEKEYQEAFFAAFPNNWKEFISTYGYIANDNYDLTMYNLAHKHIKALSEKLPLIDSATYCKKLVNIAIGGVFEADAPNYLKSLLHSVMREHSNTMLHYIAQLHKGHQMQFWQFYWSSIYKNKKYETECDNLFRLNAEKYPEEMEIMKIAFQYFCGGVNIEGGYLKAL